MQKKQVKETHCWQGLVVPLVKGQLEWSIDEHFTETAELLLALHLPSAYIERAIS